MFAIYVFNVYNSWWIIIILYSFYCVCKLSLWLLFCSTSPPNSCSISSQPLLCPILYICIWLSNLFLLCCIYTKIKRECFIIYSFIILFCFCLSLLRTLLAILVKLLQELFQKAYYILKKYLMKPKKPELHNHHLTCYKTLLSLKDW